MFPRVSSSLFPLTSPFKVINVPDLDYFKSLLSCLPSSGLCTSIICTIAWFIFLRHCHVTFLLENFWQLSIHSQRIKSAFLSLSQDSPDTRSNLIQLIFPPLFSTAPFHMPYFPANSFFTVYSPLFMQHIPLFIYLLFPEFLTDHKYTCTNHNPLEESIPKPPPSTDFSADQVLSPASEDTHQLLSWIISIYVHKLIYSTRL